MLALRRLAEHGVTLVEGHRLLAIEEDAVHLERLYDGTARAREPSSRPCLAAHAAGWPRAANFATRSIPVRAVGDARAPRLVEDAISDGYRAALAI